MEASRQPSDLHPNVGTLPHPAAPLLDDIRTQGVKATFDTPDWTLQQRQDALDRGAHRSATEHLEFVREEFAEFVKKGYWIVLPARAVMHLIQLRLSPLGVIPQAERRPRLICDHSFFGINASSISSAPAEAMQFGRALLRVIQQIVSANPAFGPVKMGKYDLADGYYRIAVEWATALALAVMLPRFDEEDALIAIPLVLPMGWTASPPYFCATTETVADLANRALANQVELPPHDLEEHALPDAEGQLLNARPLQATTAPRWYRSTPLTYVDVYVDDLLGLVQGGDEATRRLARAILHSLDWVFRPLELTDSEHRLLIASIKKLLQGDGRLVTRKTILGWCIDTIAYTLELTDRRYDRLVELLDEYPRTRQRVSLKSWQKVLGELRSMSLAMPGSRGLFGPLQVMIKAKQTRLRLTKDAHDFLDDFRWIARSLQERPTSLYELVPSFIYIIGSTDAAGEGMGGTFFVTDPASTVDDPWYESCVWRGEFPEFIVRQLVTAENPRGTISNSDLELAASVAQHDVIAATVGLQHVTVQTLHDNTPTVYWNIKGSATTSGPAAYLLRLQGIHRRQHSYYPLHDFLPGPLNSMADDASRLHQLDDQAFLTHMNSTYPQRRPWRLCTLRSEMNSALISALSRTRCAPESWSQPPKKPNQLGTCGWDSVPACPWTPTSPKAEIRFPTYKFLPHATGTDELRPAANPFDLAQFRRPYVMSARRTPVWGPLTSD